MRPDLIENPRQILELHRSNLIGHSVKKIDGHCEIAIAEMQFDGGWMAGCAGSGEYLAMFGGAHHGPQSRQVRGPVAKEDLCPSQRGRYLGIRGKAIHDLLCPILKAAIRPTGIEIEPAQQPVIAALDTQNDADTTA